MQLKYSKPMIDLIMEVRRRVPAGLKPSIKLANPEVLDELVHYYRTTTDTVSRTLIKELMHMAGPEWSQALQHDSRAREQKSQVKVYRGQTMLTDKPKREAASDESEEEKTVRVYRGQVVRS